MDPAADLRVEQAGLDPQKLEHLERSFREVIREHAPRKNAAREARKLMKLLADKPEVLQKFDAVYENYPSYKGSEYRDQRAELLKFPFRVLASVFLNDRSNLEEAVERLHTVSEDNRGWFYLRKGLELIADGAPKNLDIVSLGTRAKVEFFRRGDLSEKQREAVSACALSLTGQMVKDSFYFWHVPDGLSDGAFVVGREAFDAFYTLIRPGNSEHLVSQGPLAEKTYHAAGESIFEILKDSYAPKEQKSGLVRSLLNQCLDETNRALAELIRENKDLIEKLLDRNGDLHFTDLGPLAFNPSTGSFNRIIAEYFEHETPDPGEVAAYDIVRSGNSNNPLYAPALAVLAVRYCKQTSVDQETVIKQLDKEIKLFERLPEDHPVAEKFSKTDTEAFHRIRGFIGAGKLGAVSLMQLKALMRTFPFNRFRAEMNQFALKDRGYSSLTQLLSGFEHFYIDADGKFSTEGIKERMKAHVYTARDSKGCSAFMPGSLTRRVKGIFETAYRLDNLHSAFALMSPDEFSRAIREADIAKRQALAVDLQIDAARGVSDPNFGEIPVMTGLFDADLSEFDPTRDGAKAAELGLYYLTDNVRPLEELRRKIKLPVSLDELLQFAVEMYPKVQIPAQLRPLELHIAVGLIPERAGRQQQYLGRGKHKSYFHYLYSELRDCRDSESSVFSDEQVLKIQGVMREVPGLCEFTQSEDGKTCRFKFTPKAFQLLEEADSNPLQSYSAAKHYIGIFSKRWWKGHYGSFEAILNNLKVAAAQSRKDVQDYIQDEEKLRLLAQARPTSQAEPCFDFKLQDGFRMSLSVKAKTDVMDIEYQAERLNPESSTTPILVLPEHADELIAAAERLPERFDKISELPESFFQIVSLLLNKGFSKKGDRGVQRYFDNETYGVLRTLDRKKQSQAGLISKGAVEFVTALRPKVEQLFPGLLAD